MEYREIEPIGHPGKEFSCYEDEFVGETQFVSVRKRRNSKGPKCMCGRDIIPGDVYHKVWGTETGTGYWHASCVGAGLLIASGDSYSAEIILEYEGDGEIIWDEKKRVWMGAKHLFEN